jgi:DNA-binding CsgD family transcriptional regulator
MIEIQEIVDALERRIDEANSEIAVLTATRAALTTTGAGDARHAAPPSARARTQARPAPTQRGRGTRASVPAQPTSPKPTETTTRRSPRGARRTRGGRARAVTAAQLETLLVADGAGLPTASLAERLGRESSTVLALLRELEHRGQVRRSGQRRGTRWHWITDEERVQARAAELEQRSKPA